MFEDLYIILLKCNSKDKGYLKLEIHKFEDLSNAFQANLSYPKLIRSLRDTGCQSINTIFATFKNIFNQFDYYPKICPKPFETSELFWLFK